MASNEYNNMAELIKDYYDKPVGTYLNQSISINSVTLACDIYRVAAETVLTSSVFTGCTAVDANTQIVIGRDMSVASSTTLIPPYRCKGIVIGDVGTFTNEGTISMTARGASGAGKNIQLTNDYMISAVGGAGGSLSASVQYSNTGTAGTNGSSPNSGVLSCGGGGSGAITGDGGYTYTAGSGGTGTSFSGGAGGGGIAGNINNKVGNNGSSTGGAGGNGLASGGGAGNPKGTNNQVDLIDSAEATGTGGLIVIISNNIINSGSITSQGSRANGFASGYTPTRGNYSTGGSSGGGCIVLISRERKLTGTTSVVGGATPSGSASWIDVGGAGGAGVYASFIVDDLILINLPVEIAVTDSEHLENIDPSEAVRLMGLTDKDEFYYEIMGTRHSVGGGHSISDGTTTLTQRNVLQINAPLTAQDDSTNEVTKIGVDASGELDLSKFTPPGTQSDPTSFAQCCVKVGTLQIMTGNEVPHKCLKCDGTVYQIADYPHLAKYYEDTLGSKNFYGGNGTTTFAVPDLRGEFIRGTGTNSHSGQGSGANVGMHQDATEVPQIILEYAQHRFSSRSSNLTSGYVMNKNPDFERNDALGWLNTGDSGNVGTLSEGITSIGVRPTNTSFLMCVVYENYFIQAMHDYSTDEHIIGKWIDGKPLYERVFNDISLTGVQNWASLDDSVSYDKLIDCRYIIGATADSFWKQNSSDGVPRFSVQTSGDLANKLTYYTNSNVAHIIILVRYTKTTDTAS